MGDGYGVEARLWRLRLLVVGDVGDVVFEVLAVGGCDLDRCGFCGFENLEGMVKEQGTRNSESLESSCHLSTSNLLFVIQAQHKQTKGLRDQCAGCTPGTSSEEL